MYINHPLYVTFDKDEIINKGIPDKDLTITKSSDSIGLQIVDIYLWITNKILSNQVLPEELSALWHFVCKGSVMDGIFFEGMERRFTEFEKILPKFEDLTEEQMKFAKESVEAHRRKVCTIMKSNPDND